jgi:FkbM family methyltransferase
VRLASLLPGPIKKRLATVATFGFLSDLKSYRIYNGILKTARRGEGPFQVRIRQLDNHEITLRPGTSDDRTTFSTFWHQFHVPPTELKLPENPVFFDLGANNGLTAAHLAALYPKAKVFAVELDERNHAIATQNTAPWKDRCTVFHGGVWFEDGEVSYMFSEGAEDGFGINEVHPQGGEMVTVRSCSMETLFQAAGNPPVVDYIKMDIEGAERDVLTKNTEWMKRVRSLKIELHDYTHEECIADLAALGITARADTHHNLCVIGINERLA